MRVLPHPRESCAFENHTPKDAFRKTVWDSLQSGQFARLPFPPHGRIPNFAGAEQAAKRLFELSPWKNAKRGLDRETNKALLLQHIAHFKQEGSRLQDLLQVLPQLTRDQVQKLLGQFKKEGRIHFKGKAIAVRWYPGRLEVAPNPKK